MRGHTPSVTDVSKPNSYIKNDWLQNESLICEHRNKLQTDLTMKQIQNPPNHRISPSD